MVKSEKRYILFVIQEKYFNR